MAEFLLGKDYPRLCDPCRAAVDQTAFLLKALGPDIEEDPEAPLLQAGDLKLLCGGCYCKAAERPQPAAEMKNREYSAGVETGKYKGQAILQLPLPSVGRFFCFGQRKAATALAYMEEIRLFTEGESVENFVNVVVAEWKGHSIISLTMGSGFFRFGLTKAKALLAHKEDIQLFVEREA